MERSWTSIAFSTWRYTTAIGLVAIFVFVTLSDFIWTDLQNTTEGKWRFVVLNPEQMNGFQLGMFQFGQMIKDYGGLCLVLLFIALCVGNKKLSELESSSLANRFQSKDLIFIIAWLSSAMILVYQIPNVTYRNVVYSVLVIFFGFYLFRKKLPLATLPNFDTSVRMFLRVIPEFIWILALQFLAMNFIDFLKIDPFSDRENMIDQLLLESGQIEMIISIIFICLIGPIQEEIVFRGYLQTYFAQKWGIYWGVCISALLFSLYHADVSSSLSIFLYGLVLGRFKEKYQSIWGCIALHSLNNSLAVWGSFASNT